MDSKELLRAQETYDQLRKLHPMVSIKEQACIELYLNFLEDNYPINKIERLHEKIKKHK